MERVYAWLKDAYWIKGTRTFEAQMAAAERSVNFGAISEGVTVGYARLVGDGVTFGWVCDVIVDPEFRARGVGKALMQAIIEHPDMQTPRRVILATRDAHDLYRRYGFEELPYPERWLARLNPIQPV